MSDAIAEIANAINDGDGRRAEALCRTGLGGQPVNEDLLLLLAMSLHHQGRLPEAVEVYGQLVGIDPRSSLHWNNYGAALLDAGSSSAARDALLKAIELDPGNVSPRIQLGDLLLGLRQYVEARKVLLDAFALDRASALVRLRAARACCHCQDTDRAGALLKPWRSWTPMSDEALQLDLAQVLVLHGDMPAAAEVLEHLLLHRTREQPEAVLLLASVYERLNRLPQAEVLEPLIAQWSSTMTPEQRNEAGHLQASLAMRRGDWSEARRMLEEVGAQGSDDYAHHFQLGAVCDKLGATGAAMAALATAHALEGRQRQSVFPEFFEADSPAMPLPAPGTTAVQYARWPKLSAPAMADSPIMIVGFPRSGTTLLEQMLDAHPALQSMDENPFFNNLAGVLAEHDPRIMDDLGVLRQFDCDGLRSLYRMMVAERIERRVGARLVDKNPLNMQWLPMIHRLFPQSKIILAVRHPCDVLLSCYMQSFRSPILAAACGSLRAPRPCLRAGDAMLAGAGGDSSPHGDGVALRGPGRGLSAAVRCNCRLP
ncbi:sulfotransferase [Rhodanobacter lindaniclasticus]